MKTKEFKEKAEKFWYRIARLKEEKFPFETWPQLAERMGVNLATFRSARNNKTLPNDAYIDAIARVFEVPRDELLNGREGEEQSSMNTNNTPEEVVDLTTRRQNVALKVFSLNKSSFYAVERLMGLSPNIEFKKTEVDIYEN